MADYGEFWEPNKYEIEQERIRRWAHSNAYKRSHLKSGSSIAPLAYDCPHCGTVTLFPEKHEEWHKSLREALLLLTKSIEPKTKGS